MRIKRIIEQTRRDFTAEYECQHCGFVETRGGYDDDNFHRNVVPNMKCPVCNKKADPETFRPMCTRYPADAVI